MYKAAFLAFLLVFCISLAPKPKKEKFNSAIVRLDQNTLADCYEVSIGDWMAFMQEESNNDSLNKNKTFYYLLPDLKKVQQQDLEVFSTFLKTIEVENLEKEGLLLKSYYGAGTFCRYQYPVSKNATKSELKTIENNLNRPVVGITRVQVNQYIKWRNMHFQDNEGFAGYDNYKPHLPSDEYWDKLALSAGPRLPNNLNSAIPDSMNEKGCVLMRIKEVKPCESTLEGENLFGKTSFPVYSGYFPDKYGLYNLFGNVAEMTVTNNIAIGGSYKHYAKQSISGKKIMYNNPEPYIGFRLYYSKH